jgi:hypothetical protein
MSWVQAAVQALRQIILLSERMEVLSVRVKALADAYSDLHRRLNRMEAKFELLERMAVLSYSPSSKKADALTSNSDQNEASNLWDLKCQ